LPHFSIRACITTNILASSLRPTLWRRASNILAPTPLRRSKGCS
jgi:hypothetical protein